MLTGFCGEFCQWASALKLESDPDEQMGGAGAAVGSLAGLIAPYPWLALGPMSAGCGYYLALNSFGHEQRRQSGKAPWI